MNFSKEMRYIFSYHAIHTLRLADLIKFMV